MTKDDALRTGCSDSVEARERAAVEDTIRLFTEGIRNLETDKVVRAFHPQATSFSHTPRGICIEPAEKWPGIMDKAKTDVKHLFQEDSSVRILSVDVVGMAAAAKVEWIFQSARIVDFYNLLKVDNHWCIVNQVYHTFAVSPED
jgi:hypothetical protein